MKQFKTKIYLKYNMDKETFFFTLFLIWYFCNYLPTYNILILINNYYNKIEDFLNYYNDIIHPFLDYNNKDDEIIESNDAENIKSIDIKYEDKYLLQIRNMDKEFKLDEEENKLKKQKYIDLLKEINNSYLDKMKEIQKELNKLEKKVEIYNKKPDNYCFSSEDDNECDDEFEDTIVGITKQEIIDKLTNKIVKLYAELYDIKKYNESSECIEKNQKDAEDESHKFIIDRRLEKLQNCFVIEYTPLGNVLMLYDKKHESFKYYSDNAIPYRYLEVVARKYVKQFSCRPIFVDMEEELKIAEEKHDQARKQLFQTISDNIEKWWD
jgi:hypothetical protein